MYHKEWYCKGNNMNGMLIEFKEVFNVEHRQMVVHTTMTVVNKDEMHVQFTCRIYIKGFIHVCLFHRSGAKTLWVGNVMIIDYHKKVKELFAYELTSTRNRIMRMTKLGESYSMLSFPFCDAQALLHSRDNKTSLSIYRRDSLMHKTLILCRILSPFKLFSWEDNKIDYAMFDSLVSYLV